MDAMTQIPGQMSIFDFIELHENALDDLPESEMVKMIANATGLNFCYIDSFWGWRVKKRRVTFSVEYDNYIEDGRRFIGADWQTSTQGASSPCDSVQEAIEFFQRAIKRLDAGTRKEATDGKETL